MYQGFVSISHSEEFHVLLPIKQGLSNMVDLYGRGKSGVTLTPQVDADSHQKSSIPITSLDDLRSKSVNSLMNRRDILFALVIDKVLEVEFAKENTEI